MQDEEKSVGDVDEPSEESQVEEAPIEEVPTE